MENQISKIVLDRLFIAKLVLAYGDWKMFSENQNNDQTSILCLSLGKAREREGAGGGGHKPESKANSLFGEGSHGKISQAECKGTMGAKLPSIATPFCSGGTAGSRSYLPAVAESTALRCERTFWREVE